MTYLSIDPTGVWWLKDTPMGEYYACYECPPDLVNLIQLWRSTPSHCDGHCSGVIADWLEDHKGTLVGIYPNEVYYQVLIDLFRSRFADPQRNYVGNPYDH